MEYYLTEYSHGAGCGCKLSPAVLDDILKSSDHVPVFRNLLVGNEARDDAAVIDLDGSLAIVSTTDFFMPIVDDPRDFGGIASANAISDIYAMGAEPVMAIAILGWPIDKLPVHLAAKVLEGSRAICTMAGIPLAGGHSIDSPEPIFGLAVTGKAPIHKIKKNGDGKVGDLIYLTKPLGIGLATTAKKKKLADPSDLETATKSMLTLNKIGQELGGLPYVHAMTDVTGFGLAGHLLEICDASGTSARLDIRKIPVFDFVDKYLALGCIPGGTNRNWNAYGHRIRIDDVNKQKIIADPQTSGGLLVTVDPSEKMRFEEFMKIRGFHLSAIGELTEKNTEPTISIISN